ncbi:hypothetical protein [Mycolicibacterium sp.]|uniref:hypothetical protein n=1 Tax=Mycolicibacterium sp. TaxID=2320850 RepID=UPI00355FB670
MSETPEPATEPTVPVAPAEPVAVTERKPNRLYQVAAWVAIVAGTLVIVAVIFFAGFLLGKASDGGHGHFGHHHPGMMKPDRGGPMGPPMMRPDGFREGHMWPGPGNMGPGGPGPTDQPRPTEPPRPTDQRDSGR